MIFSALKRSIQTRYTNQPLGPHPKGCRKPSSTEAQKSCYFKGQWSKWTRRKQLAHGHPTAYPFPNIPSLQNKQQKIKTWRETYQATSSKGSYYVGRFSLLASGVFSRLTGDEVPLTDPHTKGDFSKCMKPSKTSMFLCMYSLKLLRMLWARSIMVSRSIMVLANIFLRI